MRKLGQFFARIGQAYLPHPLTIAFGLSLVALLWAIMSPKTAELADQSHWSRFLLLTHFWFEGLWNTKFLAFALQMCLVLLTGFGLARAPLLQRALQCLARVPNSNRSAVFLVASASAVGCWINWGLGLVLAGLLCCEVKRQLQARGVKCQFSLLVAAAYCGLMIWHGGLSGSAPLLVAGQGVQYEVVTHTQTVTKQTSIGLQETIFSALNVTVNPVLIVGSILVLLAMTQTDEKIMPKVDNLPAPTYSAPVSRNTFADRLNHSVVVPVAIAVLGLIALVNVVAAGGWRAINLNFVNMTFLVFGLLLHGNLSSYIAALTEGGKAIVGIVIQFPFYSGIFGIMKGAGLTVWISQGFVSGATIVAESLGVGAGYTFPVACFLSAALVNLFVPSGGGQWIVQGPIMIAAADALNLSLGKTVMAVAYGDQWTNMIQPFWAIPLMGLTNVDIREFMGYCCLLMLLMGPVFILALIFL